MTDLETLPGITPTVAAELRAVGVRDVAALCALGAAAAADRLAEAQLRDAGSARRLLESALAEVEGDRLPPPAVPVLGIDNVLFAVGDLDAALTHYADRLRLPVAFRLPRPPLALLRLGSESPGLLLREEPGLAQEAPGPRSPRVWLEVPDARAAAAALRASGVVLLAEPFPVATGMTVEVADPWGNVVGLTDYTSAPDRARTAGAAT
ncbi:MAG: VOC family protein [Pseudonocardia sp.]